MRPFEEALPVIERHPRARRTAHQARLVQVVLGDCARFGHEIGSRPPESATVKGAAKSAGFSQALASCVISRMTFGAAMRRVASPIIFPSEPFARIPFNHWWFLYSTRKEQCSSSG